MKERLNKLIAQSGICSRRKADELILSGKVKLNGKTITTLGLKIDTEEDEIRVNNQPLRKNIYIYVLLNKPKGYVTTTKDAHAEKIVLDLLPRLPARVFPVGRLDKNTEGLLLLTNDGDIAQKLLHPKFEITRVYEVTIKGKPAKTTIAAIEKGGLKIEDYTTSPCKIRVLSSNHFRTKLKLSLHEGKKREIRKIFDSFAHPVIHLKRIQFGKMHLKDLAVGEWEYIKKDAVI